MSRYSKDKDYYDEGRRDAKYRDGYDAPHWGIDQGWATSNDVIDTARDDYASGYRDGKK